MKAEDDAANRDCLTLSTQRNGTTAVIKLVGEFDLDGVAPFGAAVSRLLDLRPAAIEIDASLVTFIDSSGLRALLVARKDADAHDVRLRITRRSGPLDRVMGMTGLHEHLGDAAD
jgi:anti-sigma B factor antagonist